MNKKVEEIVQSLEAAQDALKIRAHMEEEAGNASYAQKYKNHVETVNQTIGIIRGEAVPDASANPHLMKVHIADSIESAPHYKKDPNFAGHSIVDIQSAWVVPLGTYCGNATIDLIFEDGLGRKYVGMVTASVLEHVCITASSANNIAIQRRKEQSKN